MFICPAVMTGYWRKSLGKIADTMFILKAGLYVWSSSMLEPLTVAFVAPLLHRAPWKAGRLPSMTEWESEMRRAQLEDNGQCGIICANFGVNRMSCRVCNGV